MSERPILFNGEMVRAILAGRKTQTRRPVKPQPGEVQQLRDGRFEASPDGGFDHGVTYLCCPLGQPGDRLWVRETWAPVDFLAEGHDLEDPVSIGYRSDLAAVCHDAGNAHALDTYAWNWDLVRWRPSIHMPRWASRITLEITEVRVQRVQEISEADAEAEGVEDYTPPEGCIHPDQRVPGPGFNGARLGDQPHRLPFKDVWSRIYGAESWTSNAWVWAVTFRRAALDGREP